MSRLTNKRHRREDAFLSHKNTRKTVILLRLTLDLLAVKGVEMLLKILVADGRNPWLVMQNLANGEANHSTYGFPSGHTTDGSFFYIALARLTLDGYFKGDPKKFAGFFLGTLAVMIYTGVSRLEAKAHLPGQVTAAWYLSTITPLLIQRVYERFVIKERHFLKEERTKKVEYQLNAKYALEQENLLIVTMVSFGGLLFLSQNPLFVSYPILLLTIVPFIVLTQSINKITHKKVLKTKEGKSGEEEASNIPDEFQGLLKAASMPVPLPTTGSTPKKKPAATTETDKAFPFFRPSVIALSALGGSAVTGIALYVFLINPVFSPWSAAALAKNIPGCRATFKNITEPCFNHAFGVPQAAITEMNSMMHHPKTSQLVGSIIGCNGPHCMLSLSVGFAIFVAFTAVVAITIRAYQFNRPKFSDGSDVHLLRNKGNSRSQSKIMDADPETGSVRAAYSS